MRPARVGAVARVVLAAACWGLAAAVAKHAFTHGVPPARMAEARVGVSLVLLAPLLAWRRRDLLRPPPGTLPLLLGFGACVAAVNFAYYVAIDHLAVGVAISLQYTGPVLLLAAVTLAGRRARRRLGGDGHRVEARRGEGGWAVWTAAGLTLAGAVLVSRALEGLAGADAAGLAAGLASAVLFALYLLCAEAAGRRGAAPATVLLWGFVTAVAVWSVADPWWSWPLGRLRQPTVALAVVAVGVVGTLIPFWLAVGAVRVIAATTAGIAATAEPVFATTFAWLLLGQRLTAAQLAGGALVVAGVVLAQLSARTQRPPPAAPVERFAPGAPADAKAAGTPTDADRTRVSGGPPDD
jgi:drug/metabolite transporter (DMT)-like permease